MPIEYALNCPVCGVGLEVRLAKGRKSGKPFLMAICPTTGKHIRAFINDAPYIRQVLQRLEGHSGDLHGGGGAVDAGGGGGNQ